MPQSAFALPAALPLTSHSSHLLPPTARPSNLCPSPARPQPSLAPTASLSTRRTFTQTLLALPLALIPSPARADSIAELHVRDDVTTLISSRSHARDLRATLSSTDLDVLARSAAVWLSPAVLAASRVAAFTGGIDGFAKVLPVHLAELSEEIRGGRRDGCDRELAEFEETVSAILGAPEVERYVRGKRWDGKKWSEIVE